MFAQHLNAISVIIHIRIALKWSFCVPIWH